MLEDFNLIVSTYRARENDCISELWFFASELGDRGLDASKTGLPSLIVAKTQKDPEEFVSKMREKILENPYYFRYILKVVPIQVVVPASLQDIKDTALKLANAGLEPNESFKVEVRVRLSDLKREDIIEAIAGNIKNKVNLETPDKVIVVEIIGDKAGISILKPSSIISVEKLRREARAMRRRPSSGGELEKSGSGPQDLG
ncbi:THUMP domain-containing protein [Infirmifilum sp.]|uniref:THUMP domain-containing protein n=1 Tax=Infirmifilum sp. TaxID=2856575 RepID=UPI002353FEFE